MPTGNEAKMDKEQMIAALARLNDKLKEADETGELVLFDGAVMCLVFGSRGYTRDIDAIFEPKNTIYKFAREIATEMGLPEDWLNDGVKGFIYTKPGTDMVMKLSNLSVLTANRNQVLDMVERYVPHRLLSVKTAASAEAIFG